MALLAGLNGSSALDGFGRRGVDSMPSAFLLVILNGMLGVESSI